MIVPRNIYLKWRPAPVQPIKWIRTVPGVMLAAGFAVLDGYQDVINLDIFDIPVLEGLLFLIAAFGGFLVFKGVEPIPFLKKRLLIEIGFFLFLSYGGWIWSEVLYDQQVISSFAGFGGLGARATSHESACNY